MDAAHWNDPIASSIMDAEEVARLLGTTANALRTMRAQPERHRSIDGMPDPIRQIGGRPAWSTAEMIAWWARRGRPVRFAAGHEDWIEEQMGTPTGETEVVWPWRIEFTFPNGRTKRFGVQRVLWETHLNPQVG